MRRVERVLRVEVCILYPTRCRSTIHVGDEAVLFDALVLRFRERAQRRTGLGLGRTLVLVVILAPLSPVKNKDEHEHDDEDHAQDDDEDEKPSHSGSFLAAALCAASSRWTIETFN